MTITLISKEVYDRIVELQKNHPSLTFENKGYQYQYPEPEDQEAFNEVETILRECIMGFSKFFNFRIRKDKIQLRFKYSWTADDPDRTTSFTGVGYLMLEELLNGFFNKSETHEIVFRSISRAHGTK